MQDSDFTYNLKILVVGYGSIGKRHISNLTKIGKIKIRLDLFAVYHFTGLMEKII